MENEIVLESFSAQYKPTEDLLQNLTGFSGNHLSIAANTRKAMFRDIQTLIRYVKGYYRPE